MEGKKREKQLIHVSVCMGTNCTFRGAPQLLDALQEDEDVRTYCALEEVPCLDERCDHSRQSPVVRIDDDYFPQAQPEALLEELHRRMDRKKGISK